MSKLRAMGWIAYCVKLEKGTAVHRGAWKGWLQKTKRQVEDDIVKLGPDVPYAKLVPAKVYVAVPPKPKPKPRCPTCRKEV